MNRCRICSRGYKYDSGSGHTKSICNSCMANRKRFKKKEILVEYAGGKCIRCGYGKCLNALTFHHRNPEEKDFNISGSHCRTIESLKVEVDKCDLVCMNCHTEIHQELLIRP